MKGAGQGSPFLFLIYMRFGGFQRFSMIDFQEKICSIGFTQGCNFRCPYCHNPELVEPDQFGETIAEEKILEFLQERLGKIDGVVITGGEPTIHHDLLSFIKKIKGMGFLVKLDTNGSHPDKLSEILQSGLVDYVAMDIKGPEGRYAEITRVPIVVENIRRSIRMIMDSGVPYEFRTTVVAGMLNDQDILGIARMIFGARLFILQKFLPTKTIDPDFLQEDTYDDLDFEKLRQSVLGLVKECQIR